MTTTTDPGTTPPQATDPLAAMERALLTENLGSAIVVEDAHLSAGEEIASAAHKALRYDVHESAFVSRETGEPTTVRQWLQGQREAKGYWFRPEASPASPADQSKPAGFAPDAQQPQPPGQPVQGTAAPVGRMVQEMSEHEFTVYKKQNRYARILSSVNVGGRRVLTVDCGGQASPRQVGGQALDEYRKWRETQGMGRRVGVA